MEVIGWRVDYQLLTHKILVLFPTVHQFLQMGQEKEERIRAFQEKGDVRWYEDEFIGLYLGDKRLGKRLEMILDSRMQSPQNSIPNSMATWAKTKGAYRFFSNNKADPKLILDSHRCATIKRFNQKQIILAPQDTTDISFKNGKEIDGLGYINDSKYVKGFFYHPTLAVTVEGTALGILDSQVWARESTVDGRTNNQKKIDRKRTPIEEKESYRWLRSYQTLCDIQKENESIQFVSICDREGDIFELFLEHSKNTNENKPDLLIRARTNRNIADGNTKHLYEELDQVTEFAEYDIIIPKKKNSPSREATIRLKFKEVSIKPSVDLPLKNHYPNIMLYAISASEVNPPKGVAPIHWIILTTIPTLNYEDAFEKIEWYRHRWVIEIFFKTLKSGCKIEEYQFHSFERLKRVLTIDSIIAWRILFLRTLGRECPDLPASVLFEEHEWKALHASIYNTKDVPSDVPSLSVVMRQIAQLGGHLGRKGDGQPGVITLARGLYQLYPAAIVWKLLTSG